ncbi:MAG TPA: hypothetical protein VIY29_18945 [Ktedonobacteraceae bacterium]
MSNLFRGAVRPTIAAIVLGLLMMLATAFSSAHASSFSSSINNSHTNGGNALKADEPQGDPYGQALLVWNPQTQNLVVKVSLTGLVPNSTHPSHIHLSNCSMMGAILYPLNNVVADGHGNAFTTTTVSGVTTGIPASGWYINVHHGPGLATPDQMAQIYCGNISNPSPKTDHMQVLKVKLNLIFVNQFAQVNTVASTVPGNGDVNPYGVAVVQKSVGNLKKGNILVSNFNNNANLQGTGSTIVQISPDGTQSVFAQLNASACPDGIGLTTALVELKRGWVIVGSLPAADGKFANAKAGCLIVLNSRGQVVKTWTGHHINGPWDATAVEDEDGSQATLFVTNVLNGTVAANTNIVNQGTVVRFKLSVPRQGEGTPHMHSSTVIATGFAEKTDPNALVIGPTGVGLGEDDILYVADTLNNRIIAIPNALTRQRVAHADLHVLTSGGSLNGELGLVIAPNGDIVTINGGDGNILEFTPDGNQVAIKLISNTGTPPGAGCLFGLALVPGGHGIYFVDDCTNQLNILQ